MATATAEHPLRAGLLDVFESTAEVARRVDFENPAEVAAFVEQEAMYYRLAMDGEGDEGRAELGYLRKLTAGLAAVIDAAGTGGPLPEVPEETGA